MEMREKEIERKRDSPKLATCIDCVIVYVIV